MNLDSLTLTLSQISYLVNNLSKKNYTASVQELSELIRTFGFEADRHYLRCLFTYFETGVTCKESLQLQLLSEEFGALLTKPAVVSCICFTFDNPLASKGTKPANQILTHFSKAIKLNPVQEVVLGIALLESSNPDTVTQAIQFLKIKLPELIRSYINSDTSSTSITEGGLHDTTPEVLHLILNKVLSEGSEQFGITNETKEVFLRNLRRDFPRDLVPIVLAPLLYTDNSELSMDKLISDTSNMSHNLVDSGVDDMIGELGLSFTKNLETCRGHLVQIAGRELKPGDLARVLIHMIKSVEYWIENEASKEKSQDPSLTPSPCSIENLVQASKEVNPKLNWSEVLHELDQADFLVKDRHGLNLIISTIRLGLQNQGFCPDRFPVEHMYRHWKHTEGQMSLIQQILKNPDIFCFADYPYHSVSIDILKALPVISFVLFVGLGQLVSNPGSPSRLMTASQSPAFPMMPLSATGPSIIPQVGVSVPGAMTRLQITQQQPIEKNRMANDATTLFPDMTSPVPKDIEDEANSYFQRIYNHPPHPTISIDEVLDMLKKFMESPKQRERDVFYCMLRNLFEEYKFFPQYPEKELLITAQLFGGIIERGLVLDYRELGMALRYVLDALRKPKDSKMFFFGIAALDRFKSRLKEYRNYCEHIVNIPHYPHFPSHLIEYLEFGLQSKEPPTRPQGSVIPNAMTAVTTAYKTITQTTVTTTTTVAVTKATTTSVMSSRPSIANATNIDTLLVATEKEEKMTAPPDSIQDKVAFIFNNLSQLNLQSKCDELREIMTEEYWAWMSQYLVMKRASIEPNFHMLYFNFLDVLKITELNKMVLRETFRNIRVLLRSDKGIANFSDRSLLKNLGHWLGMLTLGRNKPILQVDLDLKSLLVEAYNKGQQELLYVVPFVAKVLESCAKSKVFKPPNPWTMSIMNVLAELHQEQDLKLNLKFEIEVLCKNLSLDVSELKPGNYLKDPDNLKLLDHQLSPPKSKPEIQSTTPISLPPPQPQPQPHPVEEVTPRLSNSTPTLAPPNPPEPRFSYVSLNVSSISNIASHITLNSQLALFQAHPQLTQYVRPAVERAIQEWMHPVVERSVKIAATTTEQIVKKDFALEPDESRIRIAAHHMVRNLTAGMAMITCRDQLLVSIGNNLKASFINALHNPTEQQKTLIDYAAGVCAQDNMELGCAFIQKTAIEKAIPEMDKHLLPEYERRKHARNEGRRYCDSSVLTYQAERMPEQIRLKVGGVTAQQTAVYEELARNIPGFQPLSERDAALFTPKVSETMAVMSSFPNASAQLSYTGADEVDSMFEKLGSDLDHYVQTMMGSQILPQVHIILDLLLMARRNRDPVTAMNLIQKTVESFLELAGASVDHEYILRYRDLYLRVLKTLQDPRTYGMQLTNKQVTRTVLECREEYRYNLEYIDILIRSQLINLPQFDLHLSHAMDNGQNYVSTSFAMQLVQLYLLDDRNNSVVTEQDLSHTVDVLLRIAHARQAPDGLPALMDLLRANHEPNPLAERAPGGPTAYIHSGILQARDYEDPPGLVEKTEFLLREWVNIYHSTHGTKDPNRAFTMFVHQMNCHGILKTDDLITRFFRLSMQMVVELCYRFLPDSSTAGASGVRNKIFHTLDAYVRLIALLVKHSGDVSNTATKINLLNKVLGIVAGVLQQDHETHQTDFQQLPYHRTFIMLFLELNAPDHILEAINYQILTAYCHTLHILRPAKSPGFSYAWLELISHRLFLGRMLGLTPQQKGWGMYAQLLVDLFKYLAPFLRNAELAKPVTLLYKGTLRVLLVLLHDFPEFLCDYHYGFCDVIPPNCIQMRNLILSAFPRNMRLPDPFTPNLKVDMLSEISHAPRVLTNFTTMILPHTFKKDLDTYLKARSPVTFLSELRSNLQVCNEPGLRYNISLMNALVLYVGTQAISYIRNKGLAPNMSTIAHSAHMDIFQNLAVDLDTEGRYLFLNAIANQLRYPNSHTHYFSCTLLYLFAEANTEAIQEQITRVLLERLIVNRPHPWGLLITFIELIKNPTYKFWNHEFVHCAPEIEKLFESVARSCMVQKHVQPPAENDISELQNITSQTTFSVA